MEKKPSKMAQFWKILGPGLVTGASDDDPSGIATYSQAGADLFSHFVWIDCTRLNWHHPSYFQQ